MEIYQPAEDSYLLSEAVRKYAYGKVLDMGTGSGILAITADGKKEVTSVLAADISDDALKFAAAQIKSKKVKFAKSDLFGSIAGKFDTIIFNPPYLPQDRGVIDEAIYGGRHGHELLAKFLSECNSHLENKGIMLIVFSSRTGKDKIDEALERNCLEFQELEQKYLFFETLYVYQARKSQLLRELEEKNVTEVSMHKKGNRGIIYKAKYKGKTVAVKAQRRETSAIAPMENEAKWLKILNKARIGPKLLETGEGWLILEFIVGKFICDKISESKDLGIAIIKNVLGQCRKLDQLQINKEEMLRPQRHVIACEEGRVVMIDFERCHKSTNPKNVTQFCQFLVSKHLSSRGIAIDRQMLLNAAKNYKHSQSDENFKKIESQIYQNGTKQEKMRAL